LAAFHRVQKAPEVARLHLDFAKASLDLTAWDDADVEARLVLALYLIEAATEKLRAPAIGTLRTLSIDGKRDPMLALEGNELAAAMALFARANLSISADRPDAAVDDLERARRIWREHGWSYRAAIAELALLRIDESLDVPILDKVTATFPTSVLASDLAKERQRAESPLRSLTFAEKRVLNGICEGLTSKQIAEKLDRSHETVRVQTLSIYRKVGVNSRSALVALMRDADAS
jgi:DNA-binding CsgD family transcriptional regulator